MGSKIKINKIGQKYFSSLGGINLGESQPRDVHGLRFPGFRENWAGTTKNGLGDAVKMSKDILENTDR